MELRALEREANAQRQLLESYMARFREASSRGDGNYQPADARVFSPAVAPSEPYFPKVVPIAGATFVASLLVMTILTLMQELFSGRAMRPATGPAPMPVEQIVMPADLGEPAELREPADPDPAQDHIVIPVTAVAPERAPASPELPDPAPIDVRSVENDEAEMPEPAAVQASAAAPEPDFVHEDGSVPEPVLEQEPDLEPEPPMPVYREPLPAMQLSGETFREAWDKHKRLQSELTWLETPANDPAAEQDDEEMTMRNPFRRKPVPAELDPVVPKNSQFGEVGIERAAEALIAGGATRAIFVSPEGDEAAASAVLVAREVSDAGLRVLLLDLTSSGAASRPMLDSTALPGITNLLTSEAQFTDAIHTDNYSHCHVMPVGTADPVRAMRAADRLPIIMQSLTSAYDVVVVECGPADAEGIRRLVADGTEIMVSVLEPDDAIAAVAEELKANGYGHVTLVTPADYQAPNSPVPGRSAA